MNRQFNRIFLRLTAVFLSAAALLSLAACGGNGGPPKLDPQNPVTLTVWHYYNGRQKQAFDALTAEFNRTVGAEEGIVIEGYSQGSVNALQEKLIASAAGKAREERLPDIFSAYSDTAYELNSRGLLADLDPYFTEQELAEYREEYIEEGRIGEDGGLRIFPVAKSTEVLCLNKTMWDRFARATGTNISALATVEGITQTAEAFYDWTDSLTDAKDDGKAFFGRDAMANYILIGARQMGTQIFEVKSGSVTLNLDKDVFHRLWDNYYVPYINGWFCAYGRFRSGDMQTGDLIAYVGSTTGVVYLPEAVVVNDVEDYSIETQILPTPIFEGGEQYAVQQGAGMAVTKSEAEREYAATIFLRWFTDVERNVVFDAASAYLPVKIAANDAQLLTQAISDEDEHTRESLTKMFQVSMEQCREYMLYTPKTFENGSQARGLLEGMLSSAATADREAVLTLMQTGMSRRDAVARFDTDERFEGWFAELSARLKAVEN